ncbi:MAG TPA: histidine phosphatase family protein [Moheibacter sp.]|nr:histidine phosphatase family protein [Moheibacter sp.]
MKRIILFRHGKSLWETGVSDFDRDLSFIGIERTKKSIEALKNQLDFDIDIWYSSPAQRARRTAEMTAEAFSDAIQINFDEKLYTFSFFDLLKFIKNLDNQYHNAIFFGHNEAYTEFVNRMSHDYLDNLPTSGVAILTFPTDDWQQLGKATISNIIKPKEL